MNMFLTNLATSSHHFKKPYDTDYRELLIDACDQLAETAKFKLFVCDDIAWNVDVSPDLVVFLEQVPSAINHLKLGEKAIISLYEQGVETNIILIPHYKNCYITCEPMLPSSTTRWGSKCCEIEDLEHIILKLEVFLKQFLELWPSLLEYKDINEWLEGGY